MHIRIIFCIGVALNSCSVARAQREWAMNSNGYNWENVLIPRPAAKLSEVLLWKGIGYRMPVPLDTLAAADSLGYQQLLLSNVIRLTIHQQFSKHISAPERYGQNCAGYSDRLPRRLAEARMISANLPPEIEGYTWSDRQLDFFKRNRDSALVWMRNEIGSTHTVGMNFKQIIVALNGVELIPDLLIEMDRESIAGRHDDAIYTVVMLLMNRGDFAPWMQTKLFWRLYGRELAGYRDGVYWTQEVDVTIHRMGMYFYKTTIKPAL